MPNTPSQAEKSIEQITPPIATGGVQKPAGKGPVSASSFFGNTGVSAESFLGKGGIKSASFNGKDITSQFTPASKAAGANDVPGSLKQYADRSANPASTASNPTPGWFKKMISGTPFAPATEKDTKYDDSTTFTQPLETAGKMLLNVFSDAVGIVSAVPQAIFHPIQTVKGLVSSIAGTAEETGQAIGTGMATGDWSRLGTDVQKAEISVINHPLQTVLMMDGALESSKAVLQDPSNIPQGTVDAFNKTIDSAKTNIETARTNIAKLFADKSTVDEYTQQLQKNIDDTTAQLKSTFDASTVVDDLTKKQNDLAEKNTGAQAALEKQIADLEDSKAKTENQTAEKKADIEKQQETIKASKAKLLEQADKDRTALNQDLQKAQKALQVEQDKANALFKQKEELAKNQAGSLQAEKKLLNSFDSKPANAENATASIGQEAFGRSSGVYDEVPQDVPMDASDTLDALQKYINKMRKDTLTPSADAAQYEYDQLRLRQMMQEYSGDKNELYRQIEEEKIDKSLLKDPRTGNVMTPDELKERYQPITSTNFKKVINNIYDSISKKSEQNSIKDYSEIVEPALKKTYFDKLEEISGKDFADKIKQNDADWSSLKRNPVFDGVTSGEVPSLKKITDNWDSVVSDVSKLKGGSEFIKQFQSFIAEKVMNDAESLAEKGVFDPSKIYKGIDTYKDVLDPADADRLKRTADEINNVKNEKAAKTAELKAQKQATTAEINEKKGQITPDKTVTREAQAKLDELAKEKKAVTQKGKAATAEIEKQQSAAKEQLSGLKDTAKDIETNIKKIGGSVAEITKNIQGIDSLEALAEMVDRTGVSAEDLGKIAVFKILSKADVSFELNNLKPVLDKSGNPILDANGVPKMKIPDWDIKKIQKGVDEIDKLGGGDQAVQNALLGEESSEVLSKLRSEIKELETVKSATGKSIGKRAIQATTGVLMLTLAPFGKFFGIRQLISAFTPDAALIIDDSRARIQPEDIEAAKAKKTATTKAKYRYAKASSAVRVGENQGAQEGD